MPRSLARTSNFHFKLTGRDRRQASTLQQMMITWNRKETWGPGCYSWTLTCQVGRTISPTLLSAGFEGHLAQIPRVNSHVALLRQMYDPKLFDIGSYPRTQGSLTP